jgi:hypothetical protein
LEAKIVEMENREADRVRVAAEQKALEAAQLLEKQRADEIRSIKKAAAAGDPTVQDAIAAAVAKVAAVAEARAQEVSAASLARQSALEEKLVVMENREANRIKVAAEQKALKAAQLLEKQRTDEVDNLRKQMQGMQRMMQQQALASSQLQRHQSAYATPPPSTSAQAFSLASSLPEPACYVGTASFQQHQQPSQQDGYHLPQPPQYFSP